MRLLPVLLFTMLCLGCADQRSIVGEWTTHADEGTGKLIFRDDQTFHHTREMPMIGLVLDGTYELKGENLRMHIVKWQMIKGPKLKPEELEQLNRQFAQDSISRINWQSDDQIRITSPDGQLTAASRVKK